MLASLSRTSLRQTLRLANCHAKGATSTVAVQCFSTTSTTPLSQSAVPAGGNAEKGFMGKIMDRFSIRGQQQRILTAEMLFQAAKRKGSDPNWYGPGRIPRDFRSRHAMVTMHLWFLHKRLIASSAQNGSLSQDDCLRIQEELFEIFWNDTLCRLRAEPDVREMSVNKYLMQVQQYTFLHLFHYDHIFGQLKSSRSHLDQPEDDGEEEGGEDNTSANPQEVLQPEGDEDPFGMLDPNVDLTKESNRIDELKKLVWMHLMVRNPEAKESDDHLTRLAWYIEAQYQNILVDWPGEYVQQARVGWVNLPDFSDLKLNNGQAMEKVHCHPDDVVPEPWLTNITLRGDTYYWNPNDRTSRWEKPTAA